MARSRSESLKAVLDELDKLGVEDVQVEQGNHYHVRFTVAGQRMKYVCARSASCWRAAKNARSGVRRMVRQARGDR